MVSFPPTLQHETVHAGFGGKVNYVGIGVRAVVAEETDCRSTSQAGDRDGVPTITEFDDTTGQGFNRATGEDVVTITKAELIDTSTLHEQGVGACPRRSRLDRCLTRDRDKVCVFVGVQKSKATTGDCDRVRAGSSTNLNVASTEVCRLDIDTVRPSFVKMTVPTPLALFAWSTVIVSFPARP